MLPAVGHVVLEQVDAIVPPTVAAVHSMSDRMCNGRGKHYVLIFGGLVEGLMLVECGLVLRHCSVM